MNGILSLSKDKTIHLPHFDKLSMTNELI